MSSSSVYENEEIPLEIIFQQVEEESSEEPPMDEWSSLHLQEIILEENPKKILFEQGLFDPGSGEICTKYIAQSDSSVFKHVYYSYLPVKDPGIEKALLEPEDKIKYSDDGQELYLAICKEMKQFPVRIFYKNLTEDIIDLKYYGINPNGMRAMAMALMYNKKVTRLDLTENFLNNDACTHLAEMLMHNGTIEELIMSGCNIQSSGCARLLSRLTFNSSLKKLFLNRNKLEDDSAEHLAKAIKNGTQLEYLGLSNNALGDETAILLAEALEYKNKLRGFDLSHNNLFSQATLPKLLLIMEERGILIELDLSWNGLYGSKIGIAIGNIFVSCPNLKFMNLSNNKITTEALKPMLKKLIKAKQLATFDLSNNPLSPVDALSIVEKFKLRGVKCQNMFLDNIMVSEEFLCARREVLAMAGRESTVITHGDVITSFIPKQPDIRVILLRRADFIAMKPKKNKVDIAVWAMEQYYRENVEMMNSKAMSRSLRNLGAHLDDDLIDGICEAFAGVKSLKEKIISLKSLVEFAHRLWPERKMPPTPPPEPEPENLPPPKKDRKKVMKKKK